MQAHPVPQNIMQVEFQLVGNLTLRQFGYLAVAGLIAWLIFASPLYVFIRLPLAAVFVFLGIGLAFVPINDMRLEKWIIAFFKAVYSPTRRVWHKEVLAPDFLTNRLDSLMTKPALVHTPRVSNKARLDLYLSSIRTQARNTIDDLEERKIQTLDFNIAAPAQLAQTPDLAPESLPYEEPKAETPRIVEQTPLHETNIASSVVFTPIATIKLPDKKLFVKPMSNKRKHSLNPKTAHAGTIFLPVRGERIFAVSQGIKEKLSKYVKAAPLKSARPEVLIAAPSVPTPVPLPTPPVDHTKHLTAQMPLHQPRVEKKPAEAETVNVFVTNPPTVKAPVVAPPAPVTTPFTKPLPPTPVAANPVETTPPFAEPVKAPAPIVNVFITNPTPVETKPVEPTLPLPTPPQAPPRLPSNAFRGERVMTTPPPDSNPQPTPPVPNPETEKLTGSLHQLAAEESLLKGEVERYKQQQQFLETKLSQSRGHSSQQDTLKLKELEEQITKMQQDKVKAEERAQKLEALITQMSTTQPKQPRAPQIVTPQQAAPAVAPEVHVVSPRRAEGKMAPPMTTIPNVINGVVKDANGLLLAETIIVVKDKNDEPVRALKTNKVGQFAISTALPNGTYLMEVEKEGYEFDYIEIKLTGEILAPIEIRAKGGTGGPS